jgi:hypothetical protein
MDSISCVLEFPLDRLCYGHLICFVAFCSVFSSFGRIPICVSMERGGSKGILFPYKAVTWRASPGHLLL